MLCDNILPLAHPVSHAVCWLGLCKEAAFLTTAMLQNHQWTLPRGMLAIESSLATLRHRHLPAGISRVCSRAPWRVPGPGLSHAQTCSEVPSWVTQARLCNGLCRGATRPPPTSSCEVPPFSAGQLLNFCKFEPFLLLFKLCFRRELRSKRLCISPPAAPPTAACSSMQLSKALLLRWWEYCQWDRNSSGPSYPLQQGHVQHWDHCRRYRNALYKAAIIRSPQCAAVSISAVVYCQTNLQSFSEP